MRSSFLLLALIWLCPANGAEVMRFAVYEPGFPPFIHIEENQTDITGIIPQLLIGYAQQQHLSIEYVMDNRKGGEQRLYDGSVDAMLISPEWAEEPDKLIFTQAILPYDDYLFHLASEHSPTSLEDTSVCTREYYVYPLLDEVFRQGIMLRLDASSQRAQLRMLQNSRCGFAYINELVAYWLIERYFPGLNVKKIPAYKASTSLRIALHPRWQSHLPALNAFIQAQQDNGELDKIVQGFTGSPKK